MSVLRPNYQSYLTGFSLKYLNIAGLVLLTAALSGCNSSSKVLSVGTKAEINNNTKFSSKAYGVAASPRLTTSTQVKKGGGRAVVGKPYQIKGKWYYPKEEQDYDRTGLASWYGPNFHGRLTANGEIYDQYHLSAAHPTFPLPSYARVTNQENGKSVIVRVNDRGPYASGRIIDLSSTAADMLSTKQHGVAKVRVQYLGRAPLHGQDMKYLMASYNTDNNNVGGLLQPTMIASNSTGNSQLAAFNSNTAPAPTTKRHKDLLTIFGGKDVYTPTAEVTGSVVAASASASPVLATAAEPTVLASAGTIVEEPVAKKPLTSALLKNYFKKKTSR